MSKITLVCGTCNKNFEYAKNEYNRQTKKGRSIFYCSLSCAGKQPKNIEHLKRNFAKYSTPFKGGENKLVSKEEFIHSSMNDFLRRIKRRQKANPIKYSYSDLTVEYLIDLWNNQEGKCAYTKADLVLPSYKEYKLTNHNYKASLDRINSNSGYVIGNVQFVSFTVNNLKSNMSEEDVFEFIKLIKQTN